MFLKKIDPSVRIDFTGTIENSKKRKRTIAEQKKYLPNLHVIGDCLFKKPPCRRC